VSANAYKINEKKIKTYLNFKNKCAVEIRNTQKINKKY
jgi:hypothetical protein